MSKLLFNQIESNEDSEDNETTKSLASLSNLSKSLIPQESLEETINISPIKEIKNSWFQSFLTKTRTNTIMPPYILEPLKQTYIQDFFENTRNITTPANQEDIQDEEDDDEVNDHKMNNDEYKDIFHTKTSTTLRIFNLPYKSTIEDISNFVLQSNIKLENIQIIFDKTNELPSGQAIAEYPSICEDKVNEIIQQLNGKSLDGRILRFSINDSKKSIHSNNRRYFGSMNISIKCHQCGEVGHREKECPNDSIPPPCHLCAGNDHEAGNCLNIACFRCGGFGHHSRNCINDRQIRNRICTLCGSLSHENKNCINTNRYSKDTSLLESKDIICMTCRQPGHALCQTLPSIPSNQLFCPNCGKSGHHFEFMEEFPNQQCEVPTIEAFLKFPQLIREWNNVYTNNLSFKDKFQLCDNFARNHRLYNDQIFNFFPILRNPSSSSIHTNIRFDRSDHRDHRDHQSSNRSNDQYHQHHVYEYSGKNNRLEDFEDSEDSEEYYNPSKRNNVNVNVTSTTMQSFKNRSFQQSHRTIHVSSTSQHERHYGDVPRFTHNRSAMTNNTNRSFKHKRWQ